MTAAEIAERLRNGGVAFAFDTNAVESERRLVALCNQVLQYNERLTARQRSGVKLVIISLVYAERIFHLKQRFRDRFDLDAILRGLHGKGLEIQAYTARHAEGTAARIGERYPDTASWHRAKRDRYLHSLGLDPRTAQIPGTGQSCGATVDWHIGGHAHAEGCVLVTDDDDLELRGSLQRVELESLEKALESVLGEPE